jgi:hypothetical protein
MYLKNEELIELLKKEYIEAEGEFLEGDRLDEKEQGFCHGRQTTVRTILSSLLGVEEADKAIKQWETDSDLF